jgi:N-acetylglucosaminyldiphosphoundecaprenol N-acetyl-beta-D-mannosaminyltransferase
VQVALHGFCGSALLVWSYGRVRLFWPGVTRKETGLVPFGLFLVLCYGLGCSGLLLNRGLLTASALIVIWGMVLEVLGQGSSLSMVVGDALGAAALVLTGLQVSFLTAPSGGYIYLHSAAAPLSVLWLLTFSVLLKLANRLPGLFMGVMALLSYLLLGSMLYQQQHTVMDFRVVALLAGVSTGMWVNSLGESPPRMGRISCSLWAVTLAALTVLSTSKKLATVAVLSPIGLGLAPLAFFTFVILQSYFWPKLTRKRIEHQVYRLSVSRERVVGVLLLFCLLTDILLLMVLYVPSTLWTMGLAVTMGLVFVRIAQFVLFSPQGEVPEVGSEVDLLGTRVKRRTVGEHLEEVRRWLNMDRPHLVLTPDSLALLRSLDDPDYGRVLRSADMVLPDGAGFIWASDFLYEAPVLERIPGIEFVQALCAFAAENGIRIFLLGTRDEVLEGAVAKLTERYPGLQIVGTRNGFFSDDESEAVAEQVRATRADFCLVAMGVPKQELWMERWGEATGAKLLMGIGGSLDVLSGTLERAPDHYQALGLEWLYRTLKEPRRFTRIAHLPRFVLRVLEAKIAGRCGAPEVP